MQPFFRPEQFKSLSTPESKKEKNKPVIAEQAFQFIMNSEERHHSGPKSRKWQYLLASETLLTTLSPNLAQHPTLGARVKRADNNINIPLFMITVATNRLGTEKGQKPVKSALNFKFLCSPFFRVFIFDFFSSVLNFRNSFATT